MHGSGLYCQWLGRDEWDVRQRQGPYFDVQMNVLNDYQFQAGDGQVPAVLAYAGIIYRFASMLVQKKYDW